ncbi:hypothetical protein [Rhodococcus maanshanensis]|uniref:Uncharacterized protein n=1 Tax=Rhodococcus maanshanensis TaxID=183556 RepID=A0A1H7STJ7_9NOCA|nr:hypothetical protein [Rhodococcus maanshanensis]SEL74837.1 hypothetical protein SAMN05444583_1145 [Rhodococcus maanshanensis]
MERVRWWRKRFGRRRAVPLDATRADLVVVASSFDDAEACSRALERAAASEPGWIAEADAVLRHHLLLPADQVRTAVELAGQDRYTVAAQDAPVSGGVDPAGAEQGAEELVALVLQRVQLLDALHCSQERSRMAGLAQRAGGRVLGWDALQPPRKPVARSD